LAGRSTLLRWILGASSIIGQPHFHEVPDMMRHGASRVDCDRFWLGS